MEWEKYVDHANHDLFGNAGETSDSIRILSDDELDMVSAAGGIAERHNFLNQ
ncbi:hypothetical protein [Oribacterium sp. FC2011]|uniref:hypothetical protein n=1 Tax=Oribacterium sp. FC2011 TaxID=1408311 RepID=UPI000ABCCCAF|nr:hypothetical protein [Oribacterium sp. FC2011]